MCVCVCVCVCVYVTMCVPEESEKSLYGHVLTLFLESCVLCPVRCFPQTPQGADDKCGYVFSG